MNLGKQDQYTFYSNGEDRVVAVSSYAGKPVRGVAKCDPRDNFDFDKGMDLARARCNFKVAKKRRARAAAKKDEILRRKEALDREIKKIDSYYLESTYAFLEAQKELNKLQASM